MAETRDDGWVLLRIPFFWLAVVTVSLPSFSLLVCLASAVIFQFEVVNETGCNVSNFIPSISAVTGVTPQSYLWRICIALHCTPRFAVCFMYYNQYMAHLNTISCAYRNIFLWLLSLNFWLNIVENSCLIGVTYISNKENYPIHEKIFIVFMVSSICYMLLNTIIYRWTRTNRVSSEEVKSYRWKMVCLVGIMSATAGLIYFFIKHRFFCQPTAFSWFSACEYIIAYTNMGYHFTAAWDFVDKSFYACGNLDSFSTHTNGIVLNNNRKKQ